MGHPHRLAGCDYRGKRRVFLTACTHERQCKFANDDVALEVTSQLLRYATENDLEVSVYCAMPDHIHILLRGLTAHADFLKTIGQWKQSTGHWFRQQQGERLWQGNYWDYVLREEDDPMFFVHYAVMNPVRAGLVANAGDYCWIGSSCWTPAELIDISMAYEEVLGVSPGLSQHIRVSPEWQS